MRAFAVQKVVNWATVIGLVVVHASYPLLASQVIRQWAGVFLASWVLRLLIFVPLYRLPPSAIAKSLVLQCLPLLSSAIGCAFWVWTTTLFVGSGVTMRELVLFTGFLSISISMTGMWPVTPVTSMAYYVALWSALSYALGVGGAATWGALVVLNLSVAAVIWLNVFVSVIQVNSQLARGAELERALSELRIINAELELKDMTCRTLETRSEFFSEASHDFRQRLHAAKLWVSCVMETTRGVAEAARPLERLGQELNDLQAYIDRVLDFARIESMDLDARLQRTGIQSLFQKLDLSFEKMSARDNIALRFRRSPVFIRTDPSMLLRILENLASNAFKHTRGGVLIGARRRGAFLALEVWDQGPGIDPEAHERIFQAFHRENDTGDRVAGQGVGLGLAIVKRFADRLGYRVEVQSKAGRGTVFRVWVPAEFIEDDAALPPESDLV
ncbi:sensor histidine kinase [Variovorax ureilyticus]|uniref:sensor histidine kinase n=1 Tax=Variovorax ureilyticus TaxID=1836198 RepID=UPI003D667C1A